MSDKLIRALVKPLSFVYGKAECEVGTYVIDSGQKAGGGRWWAWALNPPEDDPFYMWQHSERAETEAAAQAAAEADYRARIAAALEVDKVAALVEAEPVFIVEFEHLTAKDEEFPDEPMTTGATVIGRDNFEALLKVMRNAGWRATDIMEREVTVPSEFAALAALGDRGVG